MRHSLTTHRYQSNRSIVGAVLLSLVLTFAVAYIAYGRAEPVIAQPSSAVMPAANPGAAQARPASAAPAPDDSALAFESATHVDGVYAIEPQAFDTTTVDNPESAAATTGRIFASR